MKINIKLKDQNNKVIDDILNIMTSELNKVFNMAVTSSGTRIKQILKNAIRLQPEYTSLMSGRLRYELGIPNTSAINRVIDTIIDTTNIKVIPIKKTGRQISGGLDISLVSIDSSLLFSEAAVVNDVDRGYILPWLKWLLFDGSAPIVIGYDVVMGSFPESVSRTKKAIMGKGGSWSISSMYAGTEYNNWLTRSVESSKEDIKNIIVSYIKRNL